MTQWVKLKRNIQYFVMKEDGTFWRMTNFVAASGTEIVLYPETVYVDGIYRFLKFSFVRGGGGTRCFFFESAIYGNYGSVIKVLG